MRAPGAAVATSPKRRIQERLEELARVLAPGRLEELYAERDALYDEGVDLKITQVQLAAWSGSTPEAVAKVLRKRRDNGG